MSIVLLRLHYSQCPPYMTNSIIIIIVIIIFNHETGQQRGHRGGALLRPVNRCLHELA